MTSSPHKDLILSYATNIAYEDYDRLLRSARAHCPADSVDIVLITNPQGPRFAELADELSVTLQPAATLWKDIQQSRVQRAAFRACFTLLERVDREAAPAEVRRLHETLTGLWAHPCIARHFAYVDLLRLRPTYRMVMLTDARDVVFQGNPFSALDPTKLHAFLQGDPHAFVYGGENLDTHWYRATYSEQELLQVAGRPIACAGTILGSAKLIERLVSLLAQHILANKRKGIDQAMYNYLINHDLKADTVTHEALQGTVLTLGDLPASSFLVEGGVVRTASGVPTVLHQYDRVDHVRDAVHARFATGA